MKNFKMIVSYDGTRYFGWEHQPDTEMTIQGKLEKVLSQMQDLPEGQSVTVIGAGRTDAGVHARAMTCNVLLDTEKTEEEIQQYMNRYLPDDISVNSVKLAAERFHSRFKAIGKTYRYTCWYGSTKPVFDRRYVTVDGHARLQELLRQCQDEKIHCQSRGRDPDRAERKLYKILFPRKRISPEHGQDHDGDAPGGRFWQKRTGGYGADHRGKRQTGGRFYGTRARALSDESGLLT